jgi:hypothetical protein
MPTYNVTIEVYTSNLDDRADVIHDICGDIEHILLNTHNHDHSDYYPNGCYKMREVNS